MGLARLPVTVSVVSASYGRWKTQKARNGYICDSLETRLNVTQHPNINFTFEKKDKNCLFLDIRVFRDAINFSTSVHRKDTFSGVFTNYAAFMPETYKKEHICTLLSRAYKINSSLTGLHDEVGQTDRQVSNSSLNYPPKTIEEGV